MVWYDWGVTYLRSHHGGLRTWCCFLRLLGVAGALMGLSFAQVLAEPPRTGLMWNKTGLPAVFPLQVKTPEGYDYVMTLLVADTGVPALAAYIGGGDFFKVLVPPGRYRVRFAKGEQWQNAALLFGPEKTTFFSLKEPLRFAVLDAGTKAGHMIDMTNGPSDIAITDQFICQRVGLARPPRVQEPFDTQKSFATRLPENGELLRFPHRFSTHRLSAGVEAPVIPTDFAPYFSNPAFDIRKSPC